MNSDFKIKTEVFEGPFSLLLELIEKHKLSINELSLSKVTEEYIEYIKKLEDYKIGEVSSFVVVAATLMLIKSRTLLPSLTVSEEEKGEIEVLEKRLEVFQVVKAISGYVKNAYGKNILYRRPFVRIKRKVFSPSEQINTQSMHDFALYSLENIPKEVVNKETKVKQAIKIEDVIKGLFDRVNREARFSFTEFSRKGITGNAKEIKTFIVVSFLAMLELIKNGTLNANQEGTFGEIIIEK